jgi:uncharacterized protein (TIGR03437 family)
MAASAPAMSSRIPVLFERNTGENASAFPFLARDKGYALLLGRDRLQLRLRGAVTTIRFAGANANAAQDLLAPSATLLNDYTGPREHWVSGAPTWQQAQYRGLYDGIDLLFYGKNGELEYDARLKPGADPDRIAFACDCGPALRITEAGDLTIPLGAGTVTWRKPIAYQTIGDRRVAVDARFTLHDGRIGFGVRKWDRRYPLVIDPTLVFSTYLGGSGSDFARAIAVDSAGNVYMAGATSSGNLPVTAASYQSSYKGGSDYGAPSDAFVAKLNPTATALTYITYLGGTGVDWALGVTTDSAGDTYVTGFTDSSDFPVTAGAYQTKFGGDSGDGPVPTGDAFATKFDPTGKLLWSTYLGGSMDDLGSQIAVDSSGNVIVTGATVSPNFPVTAGAFQARYGGGMTPVVSTQGYFTIDSGDGFVAKLNSTGSALLASTYLGGSGNDAIAALTLDSQGNIWVGGATASPNFPVSANAFQSRFGGASSQNLQAVVQLGDGFIAELNAGLTALEYSTYLGGSNDDAVTGIGIDSTGAIFACGFTQSANFPVKGASAGSYQGPATPQNQQPFLLGDAFVAKLTVAGGLTFSEFLGGSLDDAAAGMVLDSQGNPIVMGVTNSSNFPVTANAFQPAFGGEGPPPYNDYGDGFLLQVSGSTGALLYSTYIGGSNSDAIAGIAQSASGFTYLVGNTFSTNFPVTAGVLQKTLNTAISGTSDTVIMEFSLAAQNLPTIGGVSNGASYATAAYSPGEIVTIFGQNMGPALVVTAAINPSTGGLATTLSGTQVLFDGVPAPLVYVLATQSSAVIPYGVSGISSTQLTVSYNGVVSAPTTLKLAATAPGLFAANQQGSGPGAILNQNGSANSASNPAASSTYITLFGTGEGLLNPAGVTGQLAPTAPPFPTFAGAVSVTIGGVAVPSSGIYYAGPVPGFVEGLFQMDVLIPAGVPSGNQPVIVTIGGVPSQSNLTVAIQ